MGAMKKIIAKQMARQGKEAKRTAALVRQYGKICVKCDRRFKFSEKWHVCEECRPERS